jgi:hypothetical protein
MRKFVLVVLAAVAMFVGAGRGYADDQGDAEAAMYIASIGLTVAEANKNNIETMKFGIASSLEDAMALYAGLYESMSETDRAIVDDYLGNTLSTAGHGAGWYLGCVENTYWPAICADKALGDSDLEMAELKYNSQEFGLCVTYCALAITDYSSVNTWCSTSSTSLVNAYWDIQAAFDILYSYQQ